MFHTPDDELFEIFHELEECARCNINFIRAIAIGARGRAARACGHVQQLQAIVRIEKVSWSASLYLELSSMRQYE